MTGGAPSHGRQSGVVHRIYQFLTICLCFVIVAAGARDVYADDDAVQPRVFAPLVAHSGASQAQPPPPAPTPTAQPGPVTPALSAQQQRVVELVNAQRQSRGLAALRVNAKLNQAAINHSGDMARNDFMSHSGSNGSTLGQRVTGAGYSWSFVAENVAAGYDTPEEVVAAWMDSSGHRANILSSSATEVGVGVATNANSTYGIYWTLDFAKPR
jgi:uncharacterized protein YkwD